MTRIGIITQARMASTRLPGKVLLSSGGKTMLHHHVERLGIAGFPLFVATTTAVADDAIVREAMRLDIGGVHRGSEGDVLSRFAETARAHSLDVVVRVTSDCPLIDGNLVREGVEKYLTLDDEWAYVSNTLERSFPRGFDFEVFSARALYQAESDADRPEEREHVTPYIYGRARTTHKYSVRQRLDESGYRVTLDTAEDFELITCLIEEYQADQLSAGDIAAVLRANPKIALINAGVAQKLLNS